MRTVFGALCLAALAFGVSASGAQPGRADVFPFKIHEHTLANGLRIVAVPYQSPGIVSLYLVVRTGSRDEVEAGHSGFAHFFEHMMFRGTSRYPTEKYNEVLKRMGADANAYTDDDKTVYHITGPATGFATMVELEADRFQNLKYSEDAFRTEALAVLGEYNKSASNPFLALHEKLRETAFTRHTYQHTTLGFLRDIQAMPGYYEYSLRFFDRFYRPDNVVAIVVGDVAPDKVFVVMTQHFSEWKKGYQAPAVPAEPPQTEPRSAHVTWPTATRPYVMIGYRADAFSTASPDFPALDVISELLFSEAAPLYQELVVEKQWADFISGGAEDHRDPYLFTITARAKDEGLLPKVRAAIDEHLAGLRSGPVEAARIERIKSHLRYRFALSLDSPDEIADRIAHYIGLTGSVQTINELFRQYEAVTAADVHRVATRVFRDAGKTVVTLTSASEGKSPGEVRR